MRLLELYSIFVKGPDSGVKWRGNDILLVMFHDIFGREIRFDELPTPDERQRTDHYRM